MLKYIIYMITMCVIYIVLDHMHNTPKNKEQNGTSYVVKLPNALKYVCMSVIVTGVILFIFFYVLYIKGNPTVNIGHIRLALVFMGVGIFAMAMTMKWRIDVDGNHMELHRLFHKSMKFEISEIERAEIKGKITLYKDGKKLVIIDGLADNYERLEKDLRQNKKLFT